LGGKSKDRSLSLLRFSATAVVGVGGAGAFAISVTAEWNRKVVIVVMRACAIIRGIVMLGFASISGTAVVNREVGTGSSSRARTTYVVGCGIAGTGVVAGRVMTGVGTDVEAVALGQ
jgi:hypothetical protein